MALIISAEKSTLVIVAFKIDSKIKDDLNKRLPKRGQQTRLFKTLLNQYLKGDIKVTNL